MIVNMEKIHIILNPASGQAEPILYYINKILGKSVEWEVSITHKLGDATNIAKSLAGKVDLIAAYGGDGTVMEVAQGIYMQPTPLAIIPGGTANVMAKELGIPVNSEQALELILNGTQIKPIDMGVINGLPFLIRINFGILADIVKNTPRSSKDNLGQLAYGVSAVNSLLNQTASHYKLVLDGKVIEDEGAALVIANSGNVGLPGVSIIPDIDVTDGLLDVILIRTTDITALVDLATTALFNTAYKHEHFQRWRAKEITLNVSPQPNIICDDIAIKVDGEMKIGLTASAINILVPATNAEQQ
jgi:diacylglycerol kinase (ATP)